MLKLRALIISILLLLSLSACGSDDSCQIALNKADQAMSLSSEAFLAISQDDVRKLEVMLPQMKIVMADYRAARDECRS